ncbi:ABC transporter substrate-binding protein [Vibrio chagasii]|uniref:ABC transporter substrate-binding protein n=1 Tax=Vibrio chagasii TaxID=170679 RepID=UPI0022833F5F|nr:ABC transporter substrate-binding protein [Vibrio chagasii]MCY9827512.1 ABC transporter substrate-binding protein [Vibrio chagasii]
MSKFRLLPLAMLVASSFAIADDAKVFKYSDNGTPTSFDTTQAGTSYSNTIVTAVYDTLYEYKYLKVPFELKPNLAVALPEVSDDGLTYTIKIKQGVKYSDDEAFKGGKGREVVASDFVYSIKRHFDPKNRSQGAWLWAGKIVGLDQWKADGADYAKDIEGLHALDDHTIQIKLTQPFPQLTYTLAMGYSALVPHEAVTKYGRELSVHPVGSGPYKLVSHNSTKTVLERNPTYRNETFDLAGSGYDPAVHGKAGIAALDGKTLPIVDRIEANWIKQPSARWNSFTKGNEIQVSTLQNEQIETVLSSKQPVTLNPEYAEKYHYRVTTQSELIYNLFNFDDDYFGFDDDAKTEAQNKALRCAIVKSFNWDERIERFYLGLGEAYPGFILPGTDGFDPNMDKASIQQDIAGAKALLKANGWNAKNLPTLEYPSVSSTRDKQFFEQFRGNLIKIGYPKNKIKFKGYATFGDYSRDLKNSQTQMMSFAWILDYPDAENTLQLFYGPNRSPGSNSSNYSNPEYDALYKKSSVMQPSPERTAIYQTMNTMLVEDCVGIGSFSRTRIDLWNKDVVMWPQRDFVGNYFKYVDVK